VFYANGEVVSYAYGDHGLPVSVASSMWGRVVNGATYNALLQPYDVALGNGLTTSRRYNGPDTPGSLARYGMLSTLTTGSSQSLAYGYDVNGNVTAVTDGRLSESIAFSYDFADRLLTAGAPLNESFTYDPLTGNMLTKDGVGRTFATAGEPRPHAPVAVGSQTYQYDGGGTGNGNLTSAEGRSYYYDAENRLYRVDQSGSQLRASATAPTASCVRGPTARR